MLFLRFAITKIMMNTVKMTSVDTPALFGLNQSNANRDFTQTKAWGKNSFNNCFPVSLLCYMQSKEISPVYLTLDDNMDVITKNIDVNSIFGHDYDSKEIFFAFEYIYGHNQQFVQGDLPNIDLVVKKKSNSKNPWLRALEIKLTALPDNSTCNLSEDEYGCELVIRPNTIVHLTLEIINAYCKDIHQLSHILQPYIKKSENSEAEEDILNGMSEIIEIIKKVLVSLPKDQIPFVIQPIWKTVGKSAKLHDYCLDAFVWSTSALAKLLLDLAEHSHSKGFTRAKRSVWWIIRMLTDYVQQQTVNPQTVRIGFTKQTDKAFALSGKRTHSYMSCVELTHPRISKTEIKNIILGNGEKLLSPERRFDAILVNTPELFV